MSRRAAELGIRARALSEYNAASPGKSVIPGLVLGYGVADELQIRQLVLRQRLAYNEAV